MLLITPNLEKHSCRSASCTSLARLPTNSLLLGCPSGWRASSSSREPSLLREQALLRE
jgi:hypothetical protein